MHMRTRAAAARVCHPPGLSGRPGATRASPVGSQGWRGHPRLRSIPAALAPIRRTRSMHMCLQVMVGGWCSIFGICSIFGCHLFAERSISGQVHSRFLFPARAGGGPIAMGYHLATGTGGMLNPSTTLVIFLGLKSTRGGIFRRYISLKYMLKYFLAPRGLNIS